MTVGGKPRGKTDPKNAFLEERFAEARCPRESKPGAKQDAMGMNAGTEPTAQIGIGHAIVAFERINMAFRVQREHDLGIDAHAEILEDGQASGKLLALQLKSGPSYLIEEGTEHFRFPFDQDHYEYWTNHCLPVIVVLCNANTGALYWQRVARDTTMSTGKNWKVLVPRAQLVNAQSAPKLREAASPITPAQSFSVVKEEDSRHSLAKRYSASIILNTPLTKPEIGSVIRQVTLNQLNSRYYRNHLVEEHWGNTNAQVVWTFTYASYAEFKTHLPLCRSIWIDPNLDKGSAPLGFPGENIGLSIAVDWLEHNREFATLFARDQLSKADYLRLVDSLVGAIEREMNQVRQVIDANDLPHLNVERADQDLAPLEPTLDALCDQVSSLGAAPLECADLDTQLQALAAWAGNALLPYSSQGKRMWERRAAFFVAKPATNSFFSDLPKYKLERVKVN